MLVPILQPYGSESHTQAPLVIVLAAAEIAAETGAARGHTALLTNPDFAICRDQDEHTQKQRFVLAISHYLNDIRMKLRISCDFCSPY